MLSVREIQKDDIPLLLDYWFNSTDENLIEMGAAPSKMPDRNQFQSLLQQQLELPYPQKGAYCVIWELDGLAVGHSNINQIEFG